MTEQLHIIDWAILAIYFIVLLGIGLWASHKQRKSGKEAFLASKSLSWHHIGLSMW